MPPGTTRAARVRRAVSMGVGGIVLGMGQLHTRVRSDDRLHASGLSGFHGCRCMPNLGMIMPNLGTKQSPVRSAPRKARSAPQATMADALFTGTQQRVLALLFGQPERSFYATELIG